MRQPYIYTMPEAFVKDPDVPARWRIWGVLNGFFINRKKCWASNEWIGEQIRAHKDTVSQGVKELEEMDIITCERTRRTRLISPVMSSEIGAHAYLSEASTPISDRSGRLSNSDSIADKEIHAAKQRDFDIVQVVEEKPRAPKDSDPLIGKSAKWWHARCKKEYGVEPSGGQSKTQAVIKRARKSLEWSQVQQLMDDWFDSETREPGDMIQITQCLSPYRIDKFLAENV